MFRAIVIFLVTYVIISGRRLNVIKIGRPGGVLLGTVLMVYAKVIRPDQVYGMVNWDTILLLMGMMIIIEHLADADFFERVVIWINNRKLSVKSLLALVVFGLGLMAAFLVNDIVCIFFTPLLLIMIRERKLAPMPFLLALATSTNIGGMISFTGNPQNMIVGTLSGIPYARYFWMMLPVGLLGLAANYLLLLGMYRRELAQEVESSTLKDFSEPKPLLKRSLTVTFFVILGFFLGGNMAWVAIGGGTILLLISLRNESDILKRLDWNLLLFFAGLFVVIGGLQVAGVTKEILTWAQKFMTGSELQQFSVFGLVTVIGSNLFTNVPYVLFSSEWIANLANPTLLWYVLAFASTVAGNLTIMGAVANVIVVERARGVCDISFWDYFRFGLPSTIINFTIGMIFLWIYHLIGLL